MGGSTTATSLRRRYSGRLRRWLSARQRPLLELVWAAAIALGSFGFSRQAVATGAFSGPLDSFYRTLQHLRASVGRRSHARSVEVKGYQIPCTRAHGVHSPSSLASAAA